MHDARPVSGVEGSLDVEDGSAGVRLGLGLLPRAVHGLGVERLRDRWSCADVADSLISVGLGDVYGVVEGVADAVVVADVGGGEAGYCRL